MLYRDMLYRAQFIDALKEGSEIARRQCHCQECNSTVSPPEEVVPNWKNLLEGVSGDLERVIKGFFIPDRIGPMKFMAN